MDARAHRGTGTSDPLDRRRIAAAVSPTPRQPIGAQSEQGEEPLRVACAGQCRGFSTSIWRYNKGAGSTVARVKPSSSRPAVAAAVQDVDLAAHSLPGGMRRCVGH